jgi:hypothetical protein
MPSTDTKPELTAKASVAQPVSQPAVYANGLSVGFEHAAKTKTLCSCYTELILHPEIQNVIWDFSKQQSSLYVHVRFKSIRTLPALMV